MRKRLWAVMTRLALVFCVLALREPGGLGLAAESDAPGGMTYADFTGGDKVFAVQSGDIFESFVRKEGWCANPTIYQSLNESMEAVRLGRADAAMVAEDAVAALVESGAYADLVFLPIPKEVIEIRSAPVFSDAALALRFNSFLATILADGTLEEMNRRYMNGLPRHEDIPVIELTGKNGTLKAADTGNYPPMSYVGPNGELLGYGIELARRFARHLDMDLRIDLMSYDGVLPSVVSGNSDMSSCFYVITEERKAGAVFGDAVIRLGTVLAVKRRNGGAVSGPAADIGAKQSGGGVPTYEDFIGKTFAVKNGTIYDALSRDMMRSSSTLLFEDYTAVYEAVAMRKVDAGMRGYMAAYISLFSPQYQDLTIIRLPNALPLGAISMKQGVIDEFNAFLAAIRADGIYDEMHDRWLTDFDPGDIPDMPDIPLTGENGSIAIAISSDYMPFAFLGDNGKKLGFDIELALRFAAYTGKAVEFVDMPFSGMLPYVVSGKADLAVSDIVITPERLKSVLFSDPYYSDSSSIVCRKDFGAGVADAAKSDSGTGFFAWLQAAVKRNLIVENRWKMVVDGLCTSMTIALLAQALGTALGCPLCWVLTRRNRLVRRLGEFYCGLVRGLPMVVLLMISYYILFGKTNVPAMLIAVIAFALVEATSIAANLKGAIDTVDGVEIEAARSIGFSAFGAFRTVTLPQAVRRALPAYCNGFVQLVKATAIVGYIAIQDLTRAGDIIRSRTYDAYFPLLLVAAIYLLVTTACIFLFKFLVGKINGEVAA